MIAGITASGKLKVQAPPLAKPTGSFVEKFFWDLPPYSGAVVHFDITNPNSTPCVLKIRVLAYGSDVSSEFVKFEEAYANFWDNDGVPSPAAGLESFGRAGGFGISDLVGFDFRFSFVPRAGYEHLGSQSQELSIIIPQ